MTASPPPPPSAAPPSPLFDRDAFTTTHTVPALCVPARAVSALLRALRGHTRAAPRQPAVVRAPGAPGDRLILLQDGALPPDAAAVVDAAGAARTTHAVTTTYEHLSTDTVLAALLPPGVPPPAAFETVGHIAHVNLRPEHAPHAAVIGQVLLDKNPHLRTVVNKVGTITSEYRVASLDVVAGDSDLVTTVVQHGARFLLDYGTVYWNSRLETEHARLVAAFGTGDVVVDVMAGVGPFAVPAAKGRGCVVYANDLNPASAAWLATNVAANRVADRVRVSRADGRAFVRAVGGGDGGGAWESVYGDRADGAPAPPPAAPRAPPPRRADPRPLPPPPRSGTRFHHAVLNLPASAPEFLDAFRGALAAELWPEGDALPLIHVYAFAREGDEASIVARACAALGCASLPGHALHMVRDVAPSKRMWCLTFELPRGVGVAAEEGGATKRARTETV